MACISKITSSFDYNCDSGSTGVVEALLIEKADISAFSVTPGLGAVTSLTVSGPVRLIDTPKRTLVLNSALKVNEGAPNGFTHSGSLTITTDVSRTSVIPGEFIGTFINPLANASFVIITRTARVGTTPYMYRVYGLYYGMSATAMDHSTHDNGGWTVVSFSTPENVIGEDTLILTTAEYERLRALAV